MDKISLALVSITSVSLSFSAYRLYVMERWNYPPTILARFWYAYSVRLKDGPSPSFMWPRSYIIFMGGSDYYVICS
jgi:hypothetical protein